MPTHGDPDRRLTISGDDLPLSIKTRDWLTHLREEDIDTLNEAIKFQRDARIIGKFGKWLILTFAAIVIIMGQFSEAIGNIIALLTKWHK